ncbi:carbamate kinase [Clostridium sp. AM42-4]|jgi:carbamate kinase|uniref:carbamate kinase n=1 Tax=Clostridium sp. AM42-4 TaxID=2292305 RepID=UPI000E4C4E4D|nr:carbamate kinase [Clostridium sp. AM42-4]RHS88736.1 carbamate kinase [Clostridium sp. AM42-4]
MAKKRIVMALGHDALGTNLPEQKKAVASTAKLIANFIQNGWQVAVVHSNAPQVGMIHTAMNELCFHHDGEGYTPAPMSVCSAMSQGYIGYDLQNGIRSALLKRGIYKPVSTVLTQVVVDPYDESFYNPVKKVGRYMTREEADAEEAKGNYVTEVDGKGWQRIVSAPKPVGIVEIDTIRTLMDADQIVISCGGGGIPVLEQGSELRGASAVIEKDSVSGLLAKEIDADVLMILTDVDQVSLNYGKADENPLSHMTVEEAEKYAAEGQFGVSSMLPKIDAAISFICAGKGRSAIITSMAKAEEAANGKAGTTIE